MSKKNKNLLSESVVKGWGQIAGISDKQVKFLQERYEESENGKLEPGRMDSFMEAEEPEELDLGMDDEMGGDMDMGSELPDDMGMEGGMESEVNVSEEDVLKIVQSVADAISKVTNVDVDVEGGASGMGEEPEMEMEPEMEPSSELPTEEPSLDEPEEELAENAEYDGGKAPESGSLATKGGNKQDAFKGNDNGGAKLKTEGEDPLAEEETMEEMTNALTEMVYKKLMKKLQEAKKAKVKKVTQKKKVNEGWDPYSGEPEPTASYESIFSQISAIDEFLEEILMSVSKKHKLHGDIMEVISMVGTLEKTLNSKGVK